MLSVVVLRSGIGFERVDSVRHGVAAVAFQPLGFGACAARPSPRSGVAARLGEATGAGRAVPVGVAAAGQTATAVFASGEIVGVGPGNPGTAQAAPNNASSSATIK